MACDDGAPGDGAGAKSGPAWDRPIGGPADLSRFLAERQLRRGLANGG